MTMFDYIKLADKPGGSPKTLKKSLNAEFELMKGKIKLAAYYLDASGQKQAIFHVNIPSTSNAGITYSVVIQIDIRTSGNPKLGTLDFQAFSNSPSHIYTYGELFWRENMGIRWLQDKLNSETYSKPSVRNNPESKIYPERSVYLAICKIISSDINVVEDVQRKARKIRDTSHLRGAVLSQNAIQSAYTAEDKHNELLAKTQPEKIKTRLEESVERKERSTDPLKRKAVTTVKRTKHVSGSKTTKNISPIKFTGAVKRTKKIGTKG